MTKGEITQLSRSIEGLKSIKVNCNLTHYQFDSLVYALAVLERVEEKGNISLCPKCFCMTKNICGKCREVK